jgi:hypothetical protein
LHASRRHPQRWNDRLAGPHRGPPDRLGRFEMLTKIALPAALICGIASVALAKQPIPCSLDGVNTEHHHKIFHHPDVAKAYGFVKSPDGTWRVEPNCHR